MRPFLLLLSLTLVLTACARVSESRFNPLNWFGRSQMVATTPDRSTLPPLVTAGQRGQVTDARPLVDQVTALQIDRTPTGAIVTATGLTATQGAYNAELVLVSFADATATYQFRAERSPMQAAGSEATRRITAAAVLDSAELAAVRRVRVEGQQNAQVSAR